MIGQSFNPNISEDLSQNGDEEMTTADGDLTYEGDISTCMSACSYIFKLCMNTDYNMLNSRMEDSHRLECTRL